MITVTEAKEVLRHLPDDFDSHDFIEKYLTIFERHYVTMLMENIDNTNIFRTVNATIGRFLANNQRKLNITMDIIKNSHNVRENITENQNWRQNNG